MSTYESKKILRDMGMSFEHIDACENDCALWVFVGCGGYFLVWDPWERDDR